MAPVEVLQYISSQDPNPLKVKNTFLYCPGEPDLDDNDCMIRRQASEPAPKRQISGAVRAAERLEKCEEADETFGESDSDLDIDDSSGLFRQVSVLRSQNNDELPEGHDMDRQTSILSDLGHEMIKQISVMSAADLCRQETEQQWPMYVKPVFETAVHMEDFDSEAENKLPTPPPPKDDQLEESSTAQCLPLEELVAAPCFPVNPDMNSMAWPMMWFNPLAMHDPSQGSTCYENPASESRFKNRRKARSLITLAQEQQKKQYDRMLWPMNMSLLKDHFEAAPQKQPRAECKLSREDSPETKSVAQFCPNCGGKVEQRFKFCRYCGNDVAQLWEL